MSHRFNLYRVTFILSNPEETDVFYTNADTAIKALHTLQMNVGMRTIKRIVAVSVDIYEEDMQDFVYLGVDRICKMWVDYVHALK